MLTLYMKEYGFLSGIKLNFTIEKKSITSKGLKEKRNRKKIENIFISLYNFIC